MALLTARLFPPAPGCRKRSARGPCRSGAGWSLRWRSCRRWPSFFHHTDRPTTRPARALAVTRALATNEPRSLKMRTISPSLMPRAALSSGWMSRCGSPSARAQALDVDEGRIEEVARRRRNHRQRIFARQFRVAGGRFVRRRVSRQRIVAVGQHAGGIELALARWRGKAAVGERRVRHVQLLPAAPLERLPVEMHGARIAAHRRPGPRAGRRSG